LLSLSYSRYISRAHTTFSSLVELIIGVTIGFFGVVFAYSEVFDLKPDPYKIIALLEFSLIIAGIIFVIAFVVMFHSRLQRKEIVRKIKNLRTT